MSFPRTQSLSLVYRGKGLNLEKKCGTEPSDQGLEGFSNTLHLYQSAHRYYSDGTDAPEPIICCNSDRFRKFLGVLGIYSHSIST